MPILEYVNIYHVHGHVELVNMDKDMLITSMQFVRLLEGVGG